MSFIKHENILSYTEKNDMEVKTIDIECRGCAIRKREEKWDGYLSSIGRLADLNHSISGMYDRVHDNSYLTLEEEPDNEYDPNAIQVVVRGEFFGTAGYIGREYTKQVKEILDRCNAYRLDMKDESECGNNTIHLVLSWR